MPHQAWIFKHSSMVPGCMQTPEMHILQLLIWQNGHTMAWPRQLYLSKHEAALLKPCSKTRHPVMACREVRKPSPWRNRPVEESLKLFEDMRAGLINEGKACLR